MKRFVAYLLSMIVFLAAAGLRVASAQTPPIEPDNFSTSFTALDLDHAHGEHGWDRDVLLPSRDGAGFLNFGLTYPGITGVAWGQWSMDFTNQREVFRLGSTDLGASLGTDPPADPTVVVLTFYDKNLRYFYWTQTDVCQKVTIDLTLSPFFSFLTNSKMVEAGSSPDPGWETWAWSADRHHNQSVALTVQNAVTSRPLSLVWQGPHGATELSFINFTSGVPDANVFILPAACVD